jgi:hypothetical protein
MVRCGNCRGGIWGRLVWIGAGGQRRHLDQPMGPASRRMDQPMGRWSRRMDQPMGPASRRMDQPRGSSSRQLDQSVVTDVTGCTCVSQENNQSLGILPSASAEGQGDRPFVAIVRSRDELCRWLRDPVPGLQWLQVEGVLGDSNAWTEAAHADSRVSLDVVLSDPASEFSDLYRLVDACAVRAIRVTIPAAPGLLKAVKLAAALRLPVRVLPGQPAAEMLAELNEALELYLHGPMVEAPVEFFHSLLATMSGADTGSLWMILEEDPAEFLHYDASGRAKLPRSDALGWVETSPARFVENHLMSLVEQGVECATCPWQRPCSGYFKWPDPAYSCEGVKRLFSTLRAAADEIGRDLASGV